MWPALVSYFSSEDETPKRLKQVFSEKKQDETECYFSFMHCVLNGFNEINSSMQVSRNLGIDPLIPVFSVNRTRLLKRSMILMNSRKILSRESKNECMEHIH